LQDSERLSRLLALLALAFTWAFVVGLWQASVKERNVSITLRHLGEKFRLQEEAQRPFPAAAAGG
jgi:hypothetical protein